MLAHRSRPPLAGVWSLPGGRIEPGETAAEAALRELGEETGVSATLAGVVGVNDVIIRAEDGILQTHYVIAVHAAKWQSGEPRAATDVDDAAFFELSRLSQLTLTPRALELIETAAGRFPECLTH